MIFKSKKRKLLQKTRLADKTTFIVTKCLVAWRERLCICSEVQALIRPFSRYWLGVPLDIRVVVMVTNQNNQYKRPYYKACDEHKCLTRLACIHLMLIHSYAQTQVRFGSMCV